MIPPIISFLLLLQNILPTSSTVFAEDCEPILVHQREISFDANVNGRQSRIILDWGQVQSLTNDGALVQAEECHIENRIFSGDVAVNNISDINDCQKAMLPNFRLGYGFFRKSQKVFHLDFDTNAFCCIDTEASAKLTQEYEEIESDFRADGIYVTVTIKWKTYMLKFDTGYAGTIFMSTKDARRFITEPAKKYETLNFNFAVFPNKWVTIGNSYYNAAINVADRGSSKIGMGFLNGFNWVIDFRQRKVFFRKNSIGLEAQNNFPPDYTAAVFKGQLVISSKSANVKRFELGSTITKVNRTGVTPENICEIETLLESAPDWNVLEIETLGGNATKK